ncbi:MAG: hypothetical protein ACYS76_06995 [Planctomycetota bacterium]
MKRLVISGLILVAGIFIIAEAFAAEENVESKATRKSRATTRYGRTRARRNRMDADSLSADLKFLADPNAIETNVKKFEGLEKSVKDVSKAGRKEMREWTQGLAEDSIDLAQAVHNQAIEELVLVRKLALEEGASKTAAAVEALLLDRQERYGKMLNKMEAEERRMMRRSERGYRRSRGRTRNYRDRYGERDRNMEMYREDDTYRGRGRDRYQEGDWEYRRGRRSPTRRGVRGREDNTDY